MVGLTTVSCVCDSIANSMVNKIIQVLNSLWLYPRLALKIRKRKVIRLDKDEVSRIAKPSPGCNCNSPRGGLGLVALVGFSIRCSCTCTCFQLRSVSNPNIRPNARPRQSPGIPDCNTTDCHTRRRQTVPLFDCILGTVAHRHLLQNCCPFSTR